jgi:outer membrane cobalamin receptor
MKELLIAGILLCYCVDIYAAEEKEAAELEPIVITPWRIEESYYDVSRNVTVITQDGIKKSAARYLPELIENTTGVVVSDYYGNPKGLWWI